MASNRGVAYIGTGKVEVKSIDYPKLSLGDRKCEHGVILKVVATNICGSDQHMVRGRTTAPSGMILGHEITGEIVEKGRDVEFLNLGDLVSALDGQGIHKLVVVNGHGGNDFRQIIRELQPKTRVFLAAVNWWSCVDVKQFVEEAGDHAGEAETAAMMYLAPELVRPLSEAGSGHGRPSRLRAVREGWAWAPRRWTQVTADTGIGNPAKATAAKGEAYVNAAIERIADFFVELAALSLNELYE